MLHAGTLKHCCGALALACCGLLDVSSARAQTWAAPRDTPVVSQLVAVDATGEMGWPFGIEDVASDGVTFGAAEQAVDLRDAYAATGDARLWLRAYVSATAEPDASLRLFVFIDADDAATTGGSADATEIDPELTGDPTPGGYEHALGIGGDGSVIGFWSYSATMAAFVQDTMGGMPAVDAEAGVDLDPLRLGARERGYVQGSIELAEVEVGEACDSNLFFRALSDRGNDIDAPARVDCIPGDSNGDGVPNVVEPVECDSNADCPANGVCLRGDCVYPTACGDDGDCGADETCVEDRCVADGGQSCETDAECDGLICDDGTCQPCNASGVSCSSGEVCGSDGRCVGDAPGDGEGEGGAAALVDEDEKVKGGAFTCALSHRGDGTAWLLVWAAVALAALRRRSS